MRQLYYILFLMTLPLMSYAQKQKGNKAFDNLEYTSAISIYEDYLKDHDDIEVKKKLALTKNLKNITP